MEATAPLEIGTRGTIGSLLVQEIEYFKKLELERRENRQKPRPWIADAGSASHPRPKLGRFSTQTQKKKKQGSGFLPSICSVVEIVESQPDRMLGLSYQNLKTDVKKLQS